MKLNNSQLYVSTKEIQRKYDVSSATLHRWNSLGEISSIRTPGNHRLYNFDEIENIFKNNDEIMISKFQVSNMVKTINDDGTKRRLSSETTRKMLLRSHYKFRQRLKEMAELTSCVVHEVSEHYTSKSCGNCGVIDRKLGGKKEFVCPSCGFRTKRDLMVLGTFT